MTEVQIAVLLLMTLSFHIRVSRPRNETPNQHAYSIPEQILQFGEERPLVRMYTHGRADLTLQVRITPGSTGRGPGVRRSGPRLSRHGYEHQ